MPFFSRSCLQSDLSAYNVSYQVVVSNHCSKCCNLSFFFHSWPPVSTPRTCILFSRKRFLHLKILMEGRHQREENPLCQTVLHWTWHETSQSRDHLPDSASGHVTGWDKTTWHLVQVSEWHWCHAVASGSSNNSPSLRIQCPTWGDSGVNSGI